MGRKSPKTINDLRNLSHQADGLAGEGNTKGCIKLLRHGLEASQSINKVYVLFFEGELACYEASDFERCFELMEEANVKRPGDYFLLRNKGASLSNLGRDEEALILYDQALEIRPKDYDSLRGKGVSLSKLGREEEALVLFDQALEINPKDYNSLRDKGVCLSELGREEEALVLYDQALEINPKDYDSLRNKGVCLSKLGRREEALVLYDQALEINPKDHDSLRQKGVSLFSLGKHHEAFELIKEAYELEPQDVNNVSAYKYVKKYLQRQEIIGPKKLAKDKPTTEVVSKKEFDLDDVYSLRVLVEETRRSFQDDIEGFKKDMRETKDEFRNYIDAEPRLDVKRSLFFLLRKWNSYTPIVSDADGEDSVGGGYFLYHQGVGVVVDPGCNFIRNFHRAGLRIADIHHIVVTHAHNDHTADFESLLTLFYECNKNRENDLRTVQVYFSPSALMKLNSLIGLKSPEYIKAVHPVFPGQTYDLGKGLSMRILPAYHQDTVAKDYAIGVRFDVKIKEEIRRIVLTSDTSLFPTQEGEESVDAKAPEICERYGLMDDKKKIVKHTDLLIPHIGSVRPKEFEADISAAFEDVFYPNHLGVMGTLRVITTLQPGLAVVSEFGEELKNFRSKLMELLSEVTRKQCEQEGTETIKVLPGDLPFVYDIATQSVYCVLSKKFIPAAKVSCREIAPRDEDEAFFYYDSANQDGENDRKLRKAAEYFVKLCKDGKAEFFRPKEGKS